MNKENICFIYVCVKAEVKENLLVGYFGGAKWRAVVNGVPDTV